MKDTFYTHLELIEEHPSTIEKENLLIAFLQEEPDAEAFLRLTFNDDVYGLAEKSFYNAFSELQEIERLNFEHVSDFLYFQTFEEREGAELTNFSPDMKGIYDIVGFVQEKSGNDLLQFLRQRFFVMSKLDRKWISRLLLKDLRCGVQRKTVNHALEALGLKTIDKFALQLCDKIDVYDDDQVKKRLKFPIAMECKYDGIRLQAEVYGDYGNRKCKLTSRRGKDRTAEYPDICATLIKHFPAGLIILDGEIIADTFQSLTRKDDTSVRKYIVFDLLLEENLPYMNRYDNLRNLFSDVGLLILGFRAEDDSRFTYTYPTNIELAEHFSADTIEEVREYYEQLNERKEEGIILKNFNAPYERGSRKYMFKCKKVMTADLEIYEWKLGTGKRTGMISTLCLRDKSKTVYCDVGSGIDDDTCAELTKQANDYEEQALLPAKFIGKICEIKFNEVTETGSIRFPRFICIRDDKDEPDDLSNLVENRRGE
jgi:ATP-dependent DNA ligase